MVSRITAALAARYKAIQEKEKGFTLIELLVVVIIIGVLAAIAIPIYIGVQNSAKDSAVKSDLTNAKIAIVSYQTDESELPADLAAVKALTGKGFTSSEHTTWGTYAAAADGTFCIDATAPTNLTFKVTSNEGVVEGDCTP